MVVSIVYVEVENVSLIAIGLYKLCVHVLTG